MIARGTRARLLAGGAALVWAGAGVAQAPAAAPPAPSVATAAQAQGTQQNGTEGTAAATAPAEAKAGEIVVTGSRIARTEFAAPNPITSFNAAAIQDSGNTNLTNFLERVPALTGSRDFTQTSGGNAANVSAFGAVGLNELNLRNLGTSRTLVLVNGRRHVAGEANTAAVDISSIPTDLVERVDVLTGGASAVYGADGVTGVVNFILKRDFEGISARSQLGISEHGDAGNRFASVILGHNFADGRGNITVAYEYDADDPLANDDRKFLDAAHRQYTVPNSAYDPVTNPNVPQRVLVGDLRYPTNSFLGYVDVDGDGVADFNGLGRPYNFGTPAGGYYTGGDGAQVAGFYSGDLAPRIRRNDVNLLTHYDVSDAFKVSFEGKFAQTQATTFNYIPETYYYPIAVDNPFLPAAIRQAAVAAGVTDVTVNRADGDLQRLGERDLRRTYRGVIDFSGRISDHATWDAYFDYGRTDERITHLNDRLADRYSAALDAVIDSATGRIVCRSNLDPSAAAGATSFTPGPGSGCVPVSLFGTAAAGPAAQSFFTVDDTSTARITQQVADASVSGDFGALFSLPGGPVQFALGGEYRRESSMFQPSDRLLAGDFFQYDEPNPIYASGGAFNVKEAYAELNAPILKGRRFADTLSVGAAYRYSTYSTVGSTNTWQVNGVYAPVHDLTFRGSYGKAVRAPNIGELYQPTTFFKPYVTDPCTPDEIGNGSQYRAANCAATLAAVGATISPNLQSLTQSGVNGTSTGNTALKAETARTWTAGIVLRPHPLPGFTVSFDWYDIKLRNAINTPAAGDLAALCVDQPSLDNVFCRSITRAQGTGQITSFVVQPENVAAFRTAGADLNLDYLLRTARLGTFDFRFVGGFLQKLTFIATPGAAVSNRRDTYGAPKWNFNLSPTWTKGRVTVNYNLRWFDGVYRTDDSGNPAPAGFFPDGLRRYNALWDHDVQLEYRLPSGLAVYGGVQNLTDQKPDVGNAINVPVNAVGRYVYVGARLALGQHRR